MQVPTGPQILRAFGVALVVAPALALAACQSGAGKPAAAAHPSPSATTAHPSPSATTADPAPGASATAPTTRPASAPPSVPHSTAPAGRILDGKSQAFVISIDPAHRIATLKPIKMVSCAGQPTCTDDYRIKILAGRTTLPIASGATFTAAMDDTGVCDRTAPRPSCVRTITQFAAMTKQYQRKADLVVHNGAAVSINEIFTP
ncbi:hypothetical protein [Krasilnikovia sp. MM14-A1259]|uniref:hypothetical protein n=1 Tax=Krasilnikovia sp. MM14-A1259 TaxID=3373539 RepID=UPI0038032944